jgi:hypothetical protein
MKSQYICHSYVMTRMGSGTKWWHCYLVDLVDFPCFLAETLTFLDLAAAVFAIATSRTPSS